ncbi:GGDEF domain-containing protein [Sharpea porci]|uniref:GGDEF domain-containing protein n=1 Tax=Sharpea porci TaxID=2652286 RepID=UPI002A9164EA|nr:GGDEF domain-containing protein [Sharpea porci]MDY5278480.1 GGDEF domain-containing protein [Sharpea porci]
MRKIRIGLFVENIDSYNSEMIRGAQAACDELDEELIIFYGSGLNKKTQLDNPSTHNTFSYEFANKIGIDLLLLSTNNVARDMNNEEFLARFHMPIVSLNYVSDHVSSIVFDNISGAKAAVNFLITKEHRRHIGVIAGPKTRTGTRERLSAYRDILDFHHIAYDPSLIVYAQDYTAYHNTLVGQFIDMHPEIDALFCVTDKLAVCAYAELKKRGYRVGRDISVVGFDDDPYSASMVPPLSSVHADSAMLAYRAVIEGQSLLEGGIPFRHVLPTEFIARDSVNSASQEEDDLYNFVNFAINEKLSIHDLSWGMTNFLFNNKIMFHTNIKDETVKLFEDIISASFFCDSIEEFKAKVFPSIINVITEDNIQFIDLDKLFNCLKVLFDISISKHLIEHHRLDYFTQYLYSELGIVYSNITSRILTKSTEHQINVNITNRLSLSITDSSDPERMLGETLRILNIKNAALYVFKYPYHFDITEPITLPESLILKLKIKDGLMIRTHNELVNEQDLIRHVSSTHNYTLSAIASGSEQYGILITDIDGHDLSMLEYITGQFGTTFYIQSLMNKLQSQSVTDELTHIYNRRGLLDALAKGAKNIAPGQVGYVVFVDLDGLKSINDTFGHDAGDKAIILGTEIIKASFPQQIVGRWGGDEFVIFINGLNHDYIHTLEEKINENTKILSARHNYPFTLSLSFGMSAIHPGDTPEQITRIIEDADNRMYCFKKKRKQAKQ